MIRCNCGEFNCNCPKETASKVTRDTHQERILKSAVAMSRAVIGMLTSLCSKKALRQIYGSDVKDVFRTQERLEEAWKLLDPIGAKMESYHGCFTGDCPHDKQEECDKAIAEHRAELEAEAAQSPLPVTQTVEQMAEDYVERTQGPSKIPTDLSPTRCAIRNAYADGMKRAAAQAPADSLEKAAAYVKQEMASAKKCCGECESKFIQSTQYHVEKAFIMGAASTRPATSEGDK